MLYFGDRSLRNVCAGCAGSRGIYRDVCASRASTTENTLAFAQAAQVPRHLPRRLRKPRWVSRHLPGRLRRLRKSHGIYRDVCAGCASLTAFALTFAQAALGPAAFALAFAGVPASLAVFALAFAGVPASLAAFALAFAGVPASLAAFALVFAGVPQVSRHLLWCLREFPQTFSGSQKRS